MGSGRIDLPRTLTPVQRIARPFDDEHARFAAGAYGRPLLRMTFDFHANEQKQTNFIADICVRVGQAMGAERGVRRGPPQRYSIVPYQSTHNTGGAAMGTDPKTSALNRYNQTWDVSNVFVTGAPFRKTPARTRLVRSARSPIGLRMPSSAT